MRRAALLVLAMLGTALPAAAEESCVAFRLQAWGRPGHAASLDLHSAPHRLIRGLAALLPAGERGLAGVRVLAMEGSRRSNVKPSSSEALVEVTAPGDRAAVTARVGELLGGTEVSAEALEAPCRGEPAAASTAG